MNKLMQ